MDLPRRSEVVCGEYVLRTSHFDTAEPPEALADAARYRSSPDGRGLDVSVPLRPGVHPRPEPIGLAPAQCAFPTTVS